jgi:integrase
MRGRTWWFIRKIPKVLSGDMPDPYTGKAHVRKNLHTSDLREAHRRRLGANAEYETALGVAERRNKGEPVAAAMQAAEAWQRAQEANPHVSFYDEIGAEAAQIEHRIGGDVAQRFYATATGTKLTEIDAYLDAYVAAKKIGPKFVAETKRAVTRVKEWRSALSLEKFTLTLTREYVDNELLPGRAPATVNKALTALSGYWDWMRIRELVVGLEDHWPKFRPKADPKRPGEKERAFHDDEVVKLFATPMRQDIQDASVIGALTGARIEEIARIKVKDANLKTMMIYLSGTKTEAAERTIPLHSALKPIFARRMRGKRADDWLFDELPERGKDDQKGKSSPISTGFTRHRRAVGVDVRVEGKRRALTNFHSWRRWFTTVAERAGCAPHIISAVVGHKRKGETLGTYSLGPDAEKQMRKVVEAVRLPKGVKTPC